MNNNELGSVPVIKGTVEPPKTPKRLTLGKMVAYGVGIAVTAPLWVPLYCATVVGAKTARTAMKHPQLTMLGVTAGAALWYQSHKHGESINAHIEHKVHETAAYIRDERVRTLESRLDDMQQQYQQLSGQLQQQRQYSSQLDMQVKQAKEMAARGGAAVQLAGKMAASQPIASPGFFAYYLKPGESLQQAAVKLTGSDKYVNNIREWSNMTPKTEAPTGKLLWVQQAIARSNAPGVFAQVPWAYSKDLPPDQSIRECFTNESQLEEILLLNKMLGLPYTADTKGGDRPLRVYYF